MKHLHDPLYRLKKGKFLKRKLSWGSCRECCEDVFSTLNGGYNVEELEEIQHHGIMSYVFLTAFLMPLVNFNPHEPRSVIVPFVAGFFAIPLLILQSIVSFIITAALSPVIVLAHLGAQLLPKKQKIKHENVEKDLRAVANMQLQDIRDQGVQIDQHVHIPSQEKRMLNFGKLCDGSYEKMQRLYFREVSVTYTLCHHHDVKPKTYYSTKIFSRESKGEEISLVLYEENPAHPMQGIPLGIAEMKPENYSALKPLLMNDHFSDNMRLAASLDKSFLSCINEYEALVAERQQIRNETTTVLCELFKLDSGYVNSKPNDLAQMVNHYVFPQDYTSEPKDYNIHEAKPDEAEEINYPLIVPLL